MSDSLDRRFCSASTPQSSNDAELLWLTKDDFEDKRRKKQLSRQTAAGGRAITTLASIIANGSAYLILVQNGAKEVLVLTDTDQYENLRLTDQGKGLPEKLIIFYAGFAGGVGIPCNKKHYTDADFAFAQDLQILYPTGIFFFAKSKLAHTELLDAIAAAKVGRSSFLANDKLCQPSTASSDVQAPGEESQHRPATVSKTPNKKKKSTGRKDRSRLRQRIVEETDSDTSEEGSDFAPDDQGSEDDSDNPLSHPISSGRASKRSRDNQQSSRNGNQGKRRRGEEDTLGAEIQNLSSRLHNKTHLQLAGKDTVELDGRFRRFQSVKSQRRLELEKQNEDAKASLERGQEHIKRGQDQIKQGQEEIRRGHDEISKAQSEQHLVTVMLQELESVDDEMIENWDQFKEKMRCRVSNGVVTWSVPR